MSLNTELHLEVTMSDQPSTTQPKMTIEIIDGVTVLTLLDMSRPTIDAWIKAHTALIDEQGSGYLILVDTSKEWMAFSPYLRAKATDLVQARGDVVGKMALLVPSTFWQGVMKLFFQRFRGKIAFEAQVFTHLENALHWLTETQVH